jgi:hypothetical protein
MCSWQYIPSILLIRIIYILNLYIFILSWSYILLMCDMTNALYTALYC